MSDQAPPKPEGAAPSTNKPKKKRKPKKKPSDPAAATSDTASTSTKPLFPTVQSKSGALRTDYGTNDTTQMLQPIPTQVVTDRLDTVLQAVRQLDTTCDYARCSAKTTLMFLECSCCNRRFCFKHGLPEVHGCGEAIKQAERAEFLRPVPAKTRQSEEEVRKAQVRMQQKLKEMSLARKAKPKK